MFGLDSIWHLLILAVIVALIFGTSKLRNVGSDLSAAIKNFRKGLQDDEPDSSAQLKADPAESQPASSTDESKTKDVS